MTNRTLRQNALLPFVVSALLLASCRQATPAGVPAVTATPGVDAPKATEPPAPTLEEPKPGDAPKPTEPPAAAAPAAPPAPKIDLKSVNINAAALSDKVAATTLPAIIDTDPTSPGFAAALPAHVRISFGGEQLTTDFISPQQRQILIIPVKDYLEKFAATPDTQAQIKSQIDALAALVKARTTKTNEEIPVLPPFSAAQVFRSKVKYVTFKGGSGVRFVTTYAQDVLPITSADVFYTFQGLTTDGKYYVSAFIPVKTKVLAADRAAVQQKELDETLKDFDAYLKRVTGALEKQPSNGYAPNLDALDNMIKSLELKSEGDQAAAPGVDATTTTSDTVAPGVDVIDPQPAGLDATAPTTDTTGIAPSTSPTAQNANAVAQTGRTTEVLNVRASPSTRARKIAALRRGVSVQVLGRNQKSDWLQVRVGRRTGWVFATYVSGIDVNTLPLVQ